MFPHPTQREGKDGGKHDALTEITHKKSGDAGHPHARKEHGHGNRSEQGTAQQDAARSNARHEPTAAHAPQHKESHAAEREVEGGRSVAQPGIFRNIINEKTVDAGLGRHIQEQGGHAPHEGSEAAPATSGNLMREKRQATASTTRPMMA